MQGWGAQKVMDGQAAGSGESDGSGAGIEQDDDVVGKAIQRWDEIGYNGILGGLTNFAGISGVNGVDLGTEEKDNNERRLVEKALSRIQRAQSLGKENVRLPKREFEALHRSRQKQERNLLDRGRGGTLQDASTESGGLWSPLAHLYGPGGNSSYSMGRHLQPHQAYPYSLAEDGRLGYPYGAMVNGTNATPYAGVPAGYSYRPENFQYGPSDQRIASSLASVPYEGELVPSLPRKRYRNNKQ